MLSYPDFDQPFILHVDASTKGLGTGLYQHKDKKVRILDYGSRALAKAEQKYHSSKLEFLSLKWAACEQLRDYLTYAKQIEIYKDNNPLLYVLSSAKLNAIGQRWVNESAEKLTDRGDLEKFVHFGNKRYIEEKERKMKMD